MANTADVSRARRRESRWRAHTRTQAQQRVEEGTETETLRDTFSVPTPERTCRCFWIPRDLTSRLKQAFPAPPRRRGGAAGDGRGPPAPRARSSPADAASRHRWTCCAGTRGHVPGAGTCGCAHVRVSFGALRELFPLFQISATSLSRRVSVRAPRVAASTFFVLDKVTHNLMREHV